MRAEDVPICPDCDGSHLSRCHGESFAARIRTVNLGAEVSEVFRRRSYYDDDLVAHQFGGKGRKERKAEYYDQTLGYGAAETQADGSIVARDPKTKERRALSPTEVNDIYLTR